MFDRILKGADSKLSSEIAAIIHEVMKRGVAPRDIHAANFVRAIVKDSCIWSITPCSWLRPVHPFTDHATELGNLQLSSSDGSWKIECAHLERLTSIRP